MVLQELASATILIIGTGNIGQAIASRAMLALSPIFQLLEDPT
ncbi:MAG: hypothetical protein KME60_11500 [Cyanomargarita calcarea GSE-NOS-MK-12-04C]|uniref:Uncharacterized protein n=1 Tax=Cyanomargarita calcarea GSE-NOS-MK-12-04C TaxID=2839659 RepID=A0A951URW1_9CYAN|nr:hypothetical protein [Cyanomargarita calcarea GSE-NOS-MK-12-04C]